MTNNNQTQTVENCNNKLETTICDNEQLAKSKEEALKAYRREYNRKNKEKRKARYERLKLENPNYIADQNRLYRERHPERVKAQSKAYNDKTKEKRARKYQERDKAKEKEYREKNRERDRIARKKRYEKNKEAICAKQRLKRQQNKEAARLRDRQYREKNKEAANKREKEYFHKNKQECVTRNVEYRKERAKRDPLFAAKQKLRSAVETSFRRIKRNKPTNTEALLGCTWQEAKDHLESLWAEGMSWENHGVGAGCWHIDHIRPVSSFNEDELHLMNLIENLQPLWSEDNLLKSDNYEP